MAGYPFEYDRARETEGRGVRRGAWGAARRPRRRIGGEPRGYAYEIARGYGTDYGGYGTDYGVAPARGYGIGGRAGALPGKPARGYPIRGYHSYDLDYGGLAGPTTDYSGRAGFAEDRDWRWEPRGPYTPRLADIGREARRRRFEAAYRSYAAEREPYGRPGRRPRRRR